MEQHLQSTKTMGYSAGVNILVYGQSGAGKTRLIETLPSPVILSAESGLLSLSQSDIPVLIIKSLETMQQAFSWLRGSGHQFETICVDSISEIAELILMQYKKQHSDGRKAYGELQDTMSTVIRSFRDLPQHVYFTAKQSMVEGESGIQKYGPSMPGKVLTQGLSYHFDEVFRLVIGSDDNGAPVRELLTQADVLSEAKDRSGHLNLYEPPHLGDIINKIRGEKV